MAQQERERERDDDRHAGVRVDAAAQAAERRVVAEQRRRRRHDRRRAMQRGATVAIAAATRRLHRWRASPRATVPRRARQKTARRSRSGATRPTPIARSMLSSSCCCCGSRVVERLADDEPVGRREAGQRGASSARSGAAVGARGAGAGAGARRARRRGRASLRRGARRPLVAAGARRRGLLAHGVAASSGSQSWIAHLAQHRALTLSPAHRHAARRATSRLITTASSRRPSGAG